MALSAPVAASLAICAGAVAACTLLVRRGAVRETTLLPAWWWALAAAVVWSAVEAAGALAGSNAVWLTPLRLAAVALSFCPMLAVLGAKRPQHAAWTLVVAALWAVVSLPAAEALVLQRGQRLEIGDVRGWFLWILIAIGPINYLPTRQWLAALLLAAGQALALTECLPLVRRPLFAEQHVAALVLASLSTIAARPPRSAAGKYDRLWLDFRDLFGLFWALRLQERVNAVAGANQWPIELAWSGFIDRTTGQHIGEIDPAIEPTLRTSLKGLLRRFVSGRWIAERIARDIN